MAGCSLVSVMSVEVRCDAQAKQVGRTPFSIKQAAVVVVEPLSDASELGKGKWF